MKPRDHSIIIAWTDIDDCTLLDTLTRQEARAIAAVYRTHRKCAGAEVVRLG